jgi:hypothetical protein
MQFDVLLACMCIDMKVIQTHSSLGMHAAAAAVNWSRDLLVSLSADPGLDYNNGIHETLALKAAIEVLFSRVLDALEYLQRSLISARTTDVWRCCRRPVVISQ